MLIYGSKRQCPHCGDEAVIMHNIIEYRCVCGATVNVPKSFEDRTWDHVEEMRKNELFGT